MHLQQMLGSSGRLHHKAKYFQKEPRGADGNSSRFPVHSIYKARATGFEIGATGWLCILLTDLHTHTHSFFLRHTLTHKHPEIGHVEC